MIHLVKLNGHLKVVEGKMSLNLISCINIFTDINNLKGELKAHIHGSLYESNTLQK